MLRDLIVTVNSRHTAAIESWLLARGRLPLIFPTSNSDLTEYLIEYATELEVSDLRKLASKIRRRFSSRGLIRSTPVHRAGVCINKMRREDQW